MKIIFALSKNSLLIFMTFIILTLIVFTSCAKKADNPPAQTVKKENSPTPSPSSIVVSPILTQKEEVQKLKQNRKVVTSWEEYNASDIPLIAAIPEKDIFLYGMKPNGVALYVGEKRQNFDWLYMTPRFILPRVFLGDFDSNGEEELAVVLYVGSGSGVSIEELHVIDLKHFNDYRYERNDYLSQMNNDVRLTTFNKAGEDFAEICIDTKQYITSLASLKLSGEKTFKQKAAFGSIVRYKMVDGKITTEFALGIIANTFATPMFIGNVYGDVIFSEGKFSMKELRFEEYKQPAAP